MVSAGFLFGGIFFVVLFKYFRDVVKDIVDVLFAFIDIFLHAGACCRQFAFQLVDSVFLRLVRWSGVNVDGCVGIERQSIAYRSGIYKHSLALFALQGDAFCLKHYA